MRGKNTAFYRGNTKVSIDFSTGETSSDGAVVLLERKHKLTHHLSGHISDRSKTGTSPTSVVQKWKALARGSTSDLIYKQMLIVLLFVGSSVYSQSISGVIKDADTKKPIAFVNLKIPNSRQGTSTDIDGKFFLKIPKDYDGSVIISHISYKRLKIKRSDLLADNNEVLVHAKTTNLNELVFIADENPAYNIIRRAVANRKQHDPNRLSSYQYKSYSKQIVKLDGDSRLADSLLNAIKRIDTRQLTKKDSSILEVDSLVKQQHFFMSESVTEKKYLSPGLVNERLLAINTSGFKSPLFATTGTDYQPLGFYDEVITILEKSHINPIAEGTLRRYDFYIEDTTYYQQDTVFVLSFSPKANKKFESLYGQISISKNGYAIRNVIANTTDSLAKTNIKIQQFYQCFDGVWFPTQLNTDIVFKEYDVYGRRVLVEAKSYFSEIEVNKELSKKEFSDVALDPNPTSGKLHFSEQVAEFRLYGIEGRLPETLKNVRSVDLMVRPSGLYFVEVVRDGRSLRWRVVRE